MVAASNIPRSGPFAGFEPSLFNAATMAMSYGADPRAVYGILQSQVPQLTPQMAAMLGMPGMNLPPHIAQGNLAAQNPFAAQMAMDPRTARMLGMPSPYVPDNPLFSQQQINQNIQQTFGHRALPLIDRAERAFTLGQLALAAAMSGAGTDDLVDLLGRENKGSRQLAKRIKALAQRLQQQPQDMEKIVKAAAYAHHSMIPYVAVNPSERKLGESIFKNFYGVGDPKDVKFTGQGPFGNMVAGAAPGAGELAPGSFKGQGALNAAISQIGVREATGNNDGVPSQRYMDGRREPWCANFVTWAFRQAGQPLPGNQRAMASCDYMAGTFKQRSAFRARGQGQPKPGDVIFFGRPGDYTHVGIVEKVVNGRVHTVEGNTSDQVARRSYSLTDPYVQGYGIT